MSRGLDQQNPKTPGRAAVARRAEGTTVRRSESRPRHSLTPVVEPVGAGVIGKAAMGVTAGVALTAGLTVGGPVTQTASAATCKAPSSVATVSASGKSSAARAAACYLKSAGYSASVNGVKGFQRSRSMAQTGKVDGHTWSALLTRGSTPTLKLGAKGAAVVRLQLGLRGLGHRIAADGTFDADTKAAVKKLQRNQHWTTSGVAGAGTWNVLQHGGKFVTKKVSYSAHKSSSSSSKGERALAYAKKQLGDPYRFGADGPSSFDCSGLTLAAWKSVGVNLPHNSVTQYYHGKHVSKSQLKPGDLVFFYSGRSHVAIYAGGGKVIHAPRPGSTVSYIKMSYMPFAGAVRPS
ncbi:cell wall-associated NlpC family hydrolase [Friedmanniella endophytica]|uniref:Cell wall-associated NlpC family hydrolase n=1 Tax=Microlunatus kandeliicorticis TaxID=1759536 RepID=A0A7W3IPW2_9ACTN|nr:NlpC/P60 family protein [Microlunatus kandeliicorticis]MBA8793058.1 cell wall-associated NlpC family hydrolase [Microlunatus kandeliicorticis]